MRYIPLFVLLLAGTVVGQTTKPAMPEVFTSPTMPLHYIPKHLWEGESEREETKLRAQMRFKWMDQNTVGRKFSTTMPVTDIGDLKDRKIVLHGFVIEAGPFNYKFRCLISATFGEDQAEKLAAIQPKEVVIVEGFIARYEFVAEQYHQGAVGIYLEDCRLRGVHKPK